MEAAQRAGLFFASNISQLIPGGKLVYNAFSPKGGAK